LFQLANQLTNQPTYKEAEADARFLGMLKGFCNGLPTVLQPSQSYKQPLCPKLVVPTNQLPLFASSTNQTNNWSQVLASWAC
jgi:hypothetical protein